MAAAPIGNQRKMSAAVCADDAEVAFQHVRGEALEGKIAE